MSTPETELAEVKRELEKLRRDVALAAKIIGQHQARSEAAAEEYPNSRDYHEGWASGFKLSLDALHQATNGQFGKAHVTEPDETPAATS